MQATQLLKIIPTPLTAALAGVFAAVAGPFAWSGFGGAESGGTFELVVAMLLIVAFPAHALVVGFHRSPGSAGTLDRPLLKRMGAWLGAALATTAIRSAIGV